MYTIGSLCFLSVRARRLVSLKVLILVFYFSLSAELGLFQALISDKVDLSLCKAVYGRLFDRLISKQAGFLSDLVSVALTISEF